MHQALQRWLGTKETWDDEAPLFESQRGGRALTVSALNHLVKNWCQTAGLKGNYGSHTLRKTFGYIHRTVHQTDMATLMTLYNHASEKQTLAYLGVEKEELREAYLKEI